MRHAIALSAALAALALCGACDSPLSPVHPEATYLVNGIVLDPDGKPIRNLKVASYFTEDVNMNIVDTDKEGRFRDSAVTWPGYLWYVIEDVDGEDNGGRFLPDTIHFEDMEFVKIRRGLALDDKGTFKTEFTRTLQYR